MKLFLVLLISFTLSESIPAKLFINDAVSNFHNLDKGTRVYFLTNRTENDLKLIKVVADGINTNVFDYSLPQSDGSLIPIVITTDNDTLTVTKPDGNSAVVTLYFNKLTPNLNVFPVFQDSSIKFKSGVNVFFGIDRPDGKVLTLKDFSLPLQNAPEVVMYSGAIGDTNTFMFFNSSVFKENKHYRQLQIPMFDFFINQIDSSVLYTVSFDNLESNFQESGVLMTDSFPWTSNAGDTLHTVKSSGGQITLHLKPFFNKQITYNTDITVYFQNDLKQGYSFSSGIDGKMEANGVIESVEISSGGAYSIQYYIAEGSFPTGGTVPTVETTTKTSTFVHFLLSILTVCITFFLS